MAQLSDERVIAKIKAVQNEQADEENTTATDENPLTFEAAYRRAEQEKIDGRVMPHTEVRKKYEKWL